MKEPVRILSDLHLGHPASRISSAEQLRPLLEGMGTVVFNGDTWQELARAFRPRAEGLLRELEALCAELGVETVFLSGNHDPGWPGKGWVELAEGRVVITHGDAVMWGGSPWSREAFARLEQVKALWAEHRAAETDAGERLQLAREMALVLKAPAIPKGRSFLKRAMDALNPPKRAFEILRVWSQQAEEAARFAERYFPQAEVMVIGHFHHHGIWSRRGKVVVNTGAFVNPHGARWLEWRDGLLSCGRVVGKDGGFRAGEADQVWRLG
ncbi:hypothetical protein [Haloferula sargassicola]|uniref:Calcineurin-like phosphoesterase domain-containing protein n=1 Tax=Haloferula sargassicola TaxID=490096 RepID=A0ABP9UJF5_9BACT